MQKLTREQLYAGLAKSRERQKACEEEKARAFAEAKGMRAEARRNSISACISNGLGKPVKRRSSPSRAWAATDANTATDQLVRQLVDEGCSLKQIEENANLTRRQLKHYLYERLKIKLKTPKMRDGLSEEFIRKCIEEKRSYNWIAKEIGWPYTTLLGRLRKMGYDKVLTQRKWYNDDKDRVSRNMQLIRSNHLSVREAMEHMTETEAKYAHRKLLVDVASRSPGGSFMKFHQVPVGRTIAYAGEMLVKKSSLLATTAWMDEARAVNHTSRVYLMPVSTDN